MTLIIETNSTNMATVDRNKAFQIEGDDSYYVRTGSSISKLNDYAVREIKDFSPNSSGHLYRTGDSVPVLKQSDVDAMFSNILDYGSGPNAERQYEQFVNEASGGNIIKQEDVSSFLGRDPLGRLPDGSTEEVRAGSVINNTPDATPASGREGKVKNPLNEGPETPGGQVLPIDYTLRPGESTEAYQQRIAAARGEAPIPGVKDGTQPTGAQSQANIDYTLHPGETIAQYNARIATARGEIPGSAGTGGTNTFTDSGFADSQSGKGLTSGGQGQEPSTFVGIYKDIIKQLGLTDIKAEFKKVVEEQAKMQNELNDEISEINDNPWLSEGVRVKQIERMKEKYETKLAILTNKQQIYDSLYKEGVQQAQYLATGEYNAQADAAALAEKRYEAELKLLEIDPSNFKEVQGGLYDIENQKWLVQPTPVTAGGGSGGSSGGLSSSSMNSTINQIVGGFDNEQIVKDYNAATTQYQLMNSLGVNGKNPGDDIAFIYAFAKLMDPNSVVREGEYATIQKYAQSLLTKTELNAVRTVKNSNFLSAEAKQNLLNTAKAKLNVFQQQYGSLQSQYQARIDNVQGGGFNSLTNYGAAYPASQQPTPQTTSAGSGTTSNGVGWSIVNNAQTSVPIQQTNPYSWNKVSASKVTY